MKCGNLPKSLGVVDINPTEMMFWLYCPIKIPYGQIYLPDNLDQFKPIIERVIQNEYVGSSYMYITAKTLYVEGNNIGNRPGWHIDGFGTDDTNFIWYDRAPTEFVQGDFNISDDCEKSMIEMEQIGNVNNHITYNPHTLLALDNTVIHRSPVNFSSGMRSFVKVSVSPNLYDLEGNSKNHKLNLNIDYKKRRDERNHPSTSIF